MRETWISEGSSKDFSAKMKAGMWYCGGFMILFTYFYVYAVNYFRGIKADDDHSLVRRDLHSLPSLLDQYRTVHRSERAAQQAFAGPPLARRQRPAHQRLQNRQGLFGGGQGGPQYGRYPQRRKLEPELSWQYHNYTSMTYFLRHVSLNFHRFVIVCCSNDFA